ncbi:type IV conjugative transfer system protein TraL [Ahniella affigens]|nr:type IV conjugative transfer system protein TraL [Ahniella affigens]
MSDHRIPTLVDVPTQFLFLRADEAAPALCLIGAGIAFNFLIMSLVAAIALVLLTRKYRNARPDGYLLHMLWWYGFGGGRGRFARRSFVRAIFPA